MATQRRNTKQRQLILDVVQSHHDHPTADAIYADVHAIDEHISRGTVYRNLGVLAESGQILMVRVPGGNRFDLRCDDHPHIVCRNCGAVADAMIDQVDSVDERVASATGFTCVSHYTTFDGLCPACQGRATRP